MQVKNEIGTVSTKGQVTIPLAVRKRLGLRPGDRVEFVLENGHAMIRPARSEGNPFLGDVGVKPAFENDAAMLAWIRDLRDE